MFGRDESIECIQPVDLKGATGEPLCLAWKTSKYFVGAGVYLSDEGYVLKVTAGGSYYPLPAPAELKAFQAQGLLPDPLPSYSLPALEYVFGYSLWLVIAFAVAASQVNRYAAKRRYRSYASVPVSLGPPVIATEGDHFIAQAVKPLLREGERVQHQAYGLHQRASAIGYFCALTNQRLLFLRTTAGLTGPKLESLEVEALEREAIVDVHESEFLFAFVTKDEAVKTLLVPQAEKRFSNQKAFTRDVLRLLRTGTTQLVER
jgi:hypothetical protein